MFKIKNSSTWFWGVLIIFELLLIGVVGYSLTSFQAYNLIASQLQSDSAKLLNGQAKSESQYLIIDQNGRVKQGSTLLNKPIPSQLAKPTSLPDRSIVYDDLYAYRLQNLGNSNDYLVTYLPYKKNNPWPERILLITAALVIGLIIIIILFQILSGSRSGTFAVS